MVRLKRENALKDYSKRMAFQIHYGTIKAFIAGVVAICFKKFQIHLVRLKPADITKLQTSMQFQIHYGTIKTKVYKILRRYDMQFQIHYGTIKTCHKYKIFRRKQRATGRFLTKIAREKSSTSNYRKLLGERRLDELLQR